MIEYAGYLLYWDHDPRRDRLLIAFSDMDLNDPMWLPAAHVSFRLVPGQGRFGRGGSTSRRNWRRNGTSCGRANCAIA
jgi:hypothetical protein